MGLAGHFHLVPFRRYPLPPTWWGYMRPFTEKVFEHATGQPQSFEELEREHFDGSLETTPSSPCLRVWCADDPIVLPSTLEHERFKNSEVWWEPRGGHCGQCYCSKT